MSEFVDNLMAEVKSKNPSEPEFHQAVHEVAESLELVLDRHPEYRTAKILERMIEPERVIMFHHIPFMVAEFKVFSSISRIFKNSRKNLKEQEKRRSSFKEPQTQCLQQTQTPKCPTLKISRMGRQIWR